jgi:hypothetical protein
MKIQFVALPALTFAFLARADVKPNSLFADNAVFQREQSVPAWGTPREGEAITVEFAGQKNLFDRRRQFRPLKFPCKRLRVFTHCRTPTAGDNHITHPAGVSVPAQWPLPISDIRFR